MRFEARKNRLDEQLCLRSRDQDSRGDMEGQAVELLLPGDVLNRLVLETAIDAPAKEGLLFGHELARGVGEKLRTR